MAGCGVGSAVTEKVGDLMVLRVKLEIVPFGDEDKAREIGRIDIFNKGQIGNYEGFCSYGVIQLDKNNEGLFDEDVNHVRSHGAWALVHKVLSRCRI